MSRENSKKINFSSDDVRKFASERFGTLKKLAEKIGVSQPNLTQSLSGKRPFGASWRERLAEVGFFDWIEQKSEELIKDEISKDELIKDSVNVKAEPEINGILDLSGAIELSNTPASRLAQLVGVSPATFTAWQNGTATPTVEELSRLFNQVVALALSSRHATTTQATAEPETPPAQATA